MVKTDLVKDLFNQNLDMHSKFVIQLLLSVFVLTGYSHAQELEKMLHAKPVGFSGNLNITTIFYNARGIPNRYLPFNYVIAGSPVLSIYGIQVPVTFIIGKQQSSFTQPFNQFGLSPSYKWVTVHAGYRNLFFSPYTLAGHTFLGAGVELNPGKFRLAAIYGQFNKATMQDTAQSLLFSNISYKRTGMSARIGYGTENNFFDLIVLKAKDHASSLAVSKGFADSSGIAPAENTVAGYALRFTFLDKRLTLESNGALSLYTNDLNASKVEDSAFEKGIEKLNSLATARTSSELYGAIDAALRYKTRDFSVKVQYRRIDPGYQSMGAYFLNNDLENYTIAPAFMALKRRIRFSGSLGIQHDDLSKQKRAKANKVIGSANLSADLNQRLSVDVNYSNYSVNQTVKTIRFADSLKVVQSSSQLSFAPRYTITGISIAHTIAFAANLSKARELNPAREDSLNGDINTYNYLLNYQLNFMAHLASVSVSFNHTKMNSISLTDGNDGITLGLSKSWLKNKLNLSASGGWLLSRRNDEKGRIINGALQCRYNFINRHMLRLTAYYTDSRPNNPTPIYPAYSETRAEIGYGFSL
jgi:hypothetical protein